MVNPPGKALVTAGAAHIWFLGDDRRAAGSWKPRAEWPWIHTYLKCVFAYFPISQCLYILYIYIYILYIYISIYKLLPPSWCHPKLFDRIRVGRSMGQDQISPQIGFLNVIQMINTEKKHYSFNPIPPSNNDKNIVWNRHHFAICSIEIAMWGVSQHSCQTVPKTIPSQASMPTEVGPAGTLRRNFVDPDD